MAGNGWNPLYYVCSVYSSVEWYVTTKMHMNEGISFQLVLKCIWWTWGEVIPWCEEQVCQQMVRWHDQSKLCRQPDILSCLSCLLDIHFQSRFLPSCFSMALSPVKRCFPSNPWNFPVVVSVKSGNATNPLTRKPAEVRSSLGHSYVSRGSKTNSTMRRVRRSKIIYSLLIPCQGKEKRGKKRKLWKIGHLLQSAPGTELWCAASPPPFQSLSFGWPQD